MSNKPRVKRMKYKIQSTCLCFLLLAVAVIFSASCTAGYEGVIKEGNRDIIIDVENIMFSSQDEVNPEDQGPGLSKVDFSIILADSSGAETATVHSFEAASVNGTYNYTQVTIPVTGKLVRIDVSAVRGETSVYAASIEDRSQYDIFYGWEIFANVTRFKMEFTGNSSDWDAGYVTMDIAPNGGNNIRFKVDSGVTAVPVTDWGLPVPPPPPLTSRQLAVLPLLKEHPEGLKFDIYTVVVDEDLRQKYKLGQGDPLAGYQHYPWEDVWTYEEITDTGKRIGDKTYKMVKYNSGDSLNFLEPAGAGSGYNSFLIDLTTSAEDPLNKYLMFVLMVQYDTLLVPSAVDIVKVK